MTVNFENFKLCKPVSELITSVENNLESRLIELLSCYDDNISNDMTYISKKTVIELKNHWSSGNYSIYICIFMFMRNFRSARYYGEMRNEATIQAFNQCLCVYIQRCAGAYDLLHHQVSPVVRDTIGISRSLSKPR